MPEGDSLHRAATRLQVLVGETLSVEARHPRAAVLGIADALDGKRLERVEAVGKNLLLTWEGGLVLRSHLRMKGRWWVGPADSPVAGRPWLVLRGEKHQAILAGGSVLALGKGPVDRLGPDIMLSPPDLDGMIARIRATDGGREVGDVLLDQRLVAGIGNMWKAEGLFLGGVSPWTRVGDLSDEELRRVLGETSRAMQEPRGPRFVYRRAGLPCRRCATRIESTPQGDDARIAYWCPACQPSAVTAPS